MPHYAPKVLLVTSELYPLIKTGGLADFSFGLARSLKRQKADPIVLLPGYRQVLEQLPGSKRLAIVDDRIAGHHRTEIRQAKVPGTQLKVWLLCCDTFFDRPGRPYAGEDGADWPDNAERFHHFCKIAAAIGCGDIPLDWQADIVHCNDWQTALTCAYLKEYPEHPPSVFSIHNLAYQGNFPADTFSRLQLPWHWWGFDKLEFHGQLSLIKGGLVWADKITTVSPSYAQEIMTAAAGCGLDGLLRHRQQDVSGILNGVDYKTWHPAKDPLIYQRYKKNELVKKQANKSFWLKNHWLKLHGLKINKKYFLQQPLIGFIGRLCYQKGIDRLITAIEHSVARGVCWAVLGSGDPEHEQALMEIANRYPAQVSLTLNYDEEVAHQIEASCDLFLMPSVYEPCGLNQLYSLKYGTVPIVSHTGGLIDSVVDFDGSNLENATGFVFHGERPGSLQSTLDHAIACYQDQSIWKALQKNGLNADFSWERSAEQYLDLYHQLLASEQSEPHTKLSHVKLAT